MILLGIEGGGTRTSSLLVDDKTQEVISNFEIGPGNIHLLPGDSLDAHLREIADRLPLLPDRIGIGMAGVRTVGDRDRVGSAVARMWPGIPKVVEDDLIPALDATDWDTQCVAQVLLLSGTGSCCLARRQDGTKVKVGGRGHVIGDRGSAMDIASHALRSIVTISDIRDEWPPLGADILNFLQMNDSESLIEWSMIARKTEIASIAQVVFQAAVERADDIAVSILQRAAERLAKDAAICAARIVERGEKVQFVLNGGVLLKNPIFADGVIARLLERRPGSVVTRLTRPSVWGCIALARSAESGADEDSAIPSVDSVDLVTTSGTALWRPSEPSPTEGRHPKSTRLSEMPISDAIRLMLTEDADLPDCILAESANIEWTVRKIVEAFSQGGRLFYCGAGTSGRLGVLDASECPPTFRSPIGQVQGIIAGGRRALWSAIEGAEDDLASGRGAIRFRNITAKDVVVGITTSGHAPFVWGCLEEAKSRGATAVLLCCHPGYRDHPLLDCAILPNTGPEILTGSTRLRAGTATKMILNILSTLAMTHTGKVMGNLMVNLNPSNTKLRDRAVRIVQELTGVDRATAKAALESAGWIIRDVALPEK